MAKQRVINGISFWSMQKWGVSKIVPMKIDPFITWDDVQ